LKLEQKIRGKSDFETKKKTKKKNLERQTKIDVVVTCHPNIAVVNRSINLLNDNVMLHFRKILKIRQKNGIRQVSLQRKIKWW
jgi:hypothetical protein